MRKIDGNGVLIALGGIEKLTKSINARDFKQSQRVFGFKFNAGGMVDKSDSVKFYKRSDDDFRMVLFNGSKIVYDISGINEKNLEYIFGCFAKTHVKNH